MVVTTNTHMRMAAAKKRKLSTANRRLRERSRLSFLFVIFFFGLFSLIIVMESLMADGDKNLLKDEDLDVDGEDYSNWDISYEESPPGGGVQPVSSSSAAIASLASSTAVGTGGAAPGLPLISSSSSFSSRNAVLATKTNNQDNKNRIKVASINIPYTSSLRYQGAAVVKQQQALQHVDLHASTLAASLFGNNSSIHSRHPPVQTNNNKPNNRKGTKIGAVPIISSSSGQLSGSSSSFSSTSPRTVHPIQPDWQKVVGTKEKFYVYSAYYNTVFDHIRIIGATRTKTSQHVQCRFYDNTTKLYATVEGTVRTIRENWNLQYSACFIICYLPDRKVKPRYVSVMANASPTTAASNILRVQYPLEKKYKLVDFAACVKPIHFNYNNVLNFLEWMEFHKLMGVQRFTFFNHTIGKEVSCLMREYGDQVEVLPWSLPFVSQKEIRTEGLFAALNDCVYRHRGASKYLVLVDLDEMIVPRKTQNYSMFIEQLDTLSNKKKIGAYSLQNAFFYMQWPNDQSVFKIEGNPLAERISKQLTMLRKTRRRSRLHPHKQRSKYICDPEKVTEAGNHFVWEMATGYFTLSVPPHLGTLHHYRVCEFGGDQCTKSPSIIDKSAHTFGQKLAVRVAHMLESMKDKCQLDLKKILRFNETSSAGGINNETKRPAKIKKKV